MNAAPTTEGPQDAASICVSTEHERSMAGPPFQTMQNMLPDICCTSLIGKRSIPRCKSNSIFGQHRLLQKGLYHSFKLPEHSPQCPQRFNLRCSLHPAGGSSFL